jgi:hypothetical protein
MQTLQNGITVFTNGDDYNLADDMADFGKSANVIIPVTSQAQRDGLEDKFIGMTVRRLDFRGTLEWWKGGAADNWESERGIAYTPIWSGVADFGSGGSLTGTYWVRGDQVTVRAKAKFGDSALSDAGAMGTAPVFCPLPPGYPIAGAENVTLGTGFHVAAGGLISSLVVFASSSTSASVWVGGVPVKTPGEAGLTGANGNYMEIAITYQTSAV